MAQLIYDETGRLLFTEEMKKEYTILIPQMLPVHFTIMRQILETKGFRCETLGGDPREIVDTGLKYVHNDTCYPALLVIGQLINAVNSGKYDVNKVALLITQTGGGCRASNYIHLLRKALKKAGLEQIPVISLNLSGLEKNPGFKLSFDLGIKMAYAMVYGDLIVLLANQTRPYELNAGETDRMVSYWMDRLVKEFSEGVKVGRKKVNENMDLICADFAKIPVGEKNKTKVGVVGEIYVKYSPLGNNNLEEFLLAEGCEPVVPGLMDFIIFKVYNREVDVNLYGGSTIKKIACHILKGYIERYQQDMIDTINKYPMFRAPGTFRHLEHLAMDYRGAGNKMGEGWLLTGEMLELINDGVNNIVCTQPFGCLPNHIVGKGMIRRIKDDYPESNIVAIDYDPSATRINQENRIKLMLAVAKENLDRRTIQ
ncbi:MAG: 2-hydroxyacyl-CoA dehydratase [Oscillospiraceae bacterium]|nr:2-hydroxyacyl-CoA dehydratase [Oscillospiraceae bacterium]